MTKKELPRFVANRAELDELGRNLKQYPCPHCGVIGMLNRHGLLSGYSNESDTEKVFRAQRVYCSNRGRRTGCGRTASACIGIFIRRFTITTISLWQLLLTVFFAIQPPSAQPRPSPRHRRKLLARVKANMTGIRTCLHRLSRPPPTEASDPLAETIHHLRSIFADHEDPIAEFQCRFQRSFL